MPTKQVVLKGYGVSEKTARKIIKLARKANSKKECPYRIHWVQWSIWMTSFSNKRFNPNHIYNSLVHAGVPCNVTQNSSTDYPNLLPHKGTKHETTNTREADNNG